MLYKILITLVLGILSGYFLVPQSFVASLGNISNFALNILLFSVGIDLGFNKKVFKGIRAKGLNIVLIPLSVVIGSALGGFIAAKIYCMPLNISLSIASGYGWYSLSGVLLSSLCSVEVGTISFLTNIMRELIAIITIPMISKKLNKYTAIAPAGATSMDSTLPIISKFTDEETVVIAFINGTILTALVPILVPLFYKLPF